MIIKLSEGTKKGTKTNEPCVLKMNKNRYSNGKKNPESGLKSPDTPHLHQNNNGQNNSWELVPTLKTRKHMTIRPIEKTK